MSNPIKNWMLFLALDWIIWVWPLTFETHETNSDELLKRRYIYTNDEAQAKANSRITNSHIQDLGFCIYSADCDSWVVDLLWRSVFSIGLPLIVNSGHDASSRDCAEVTKYLSCGVWRLVTPWCCVCCTVHVRMNVEVLCWGCRVSHQLHRATSGDFSVLSGWTVVMLNLAVFGWQF